MALMLNLGVNADSLSYQEEHGGQTGGTPEMPLCA